MGMRMQATVEVMFPDGLREVPAHYVAIDPDDRLNIGGLTPNDMDGWEFRRIIGGRDYEWVANAYFPARSYYQPPEFLADEYGFLPN